MGQWVNKKHLTQQDYNDIVGMPFITYHVAWVVSSCLLQYLQYAPLYIRTFFVVCFVLVSVTMTRTRMATQIYSLS